MCLKLAHYLLTLLLFYVTWLLFRYGKLTGINRYGYRYNYFVAAGYAVLVFFFNRTYNAYLLGYSRIRALIFAQFLSQLFSAGIMWLATAIGWNQWHNPWIFFVLLAVQFLMNGAWSYFATAYYIRNFPPKKTILIYRNNLDKKRFGSLKGKPSERLYKIVEEFQYDGYSFQQIRERLIELERRVNIIDNAVTQHSEELDELQRTKHGSDAVAVPTVTEDEENGDQEKAAPEWMVDAGAAPETMAEADPEETGDTPPWTVVGADPETIDGYFNTGE